MATIEEQIAEFSNKERKAARDEIKKNCRRLVHINPESYIAKEIKYQTALLHEILNEIREEMWSQRKRQEKALGEIKEMPEEMK